MESQEFLPDPVFLQAQLSQLPQLLLVGITLWTFPELRSHPDLYPENKEWEGIPAQEPGWAQVGN